MEYIIIAIAAATASLLTFYSGFGLGTLLTPVFMFWFPIDVSIAMTGIVHFFNNIFKFQLTYKHVNWKIAWRFCSTAIVASIFGAWLLTQWSNDQVLYSYHFGSKLCNITILKLVMATLMLLFVLLELIPRFSKMSFEPNKMYWGGLLSGFFGGLAGFQGALRSMFLLKSNLSKESYIGTGIFIACMIDISRMGTYFNALNLTLIKQSIGLIIVAILAAFLGAYLGNKWLKKIEINQVQRLVSILLLIFAALLGMGIL